MSDSLVYALQDPGNALWGWSQVCTDTARREREGCDSGPGGGAWGSAFQEEAALLLTSSLHPGHTHLYLEQGICTYECPEMAPLRSVQMGVAGSGVFPSSLLTSPPRGGS